MLRILSDFELPGGICHAYSGSLQQAERFIAQGFKLGFGGMLTFERSSRLRKLAGTLPVESLVLETDAPDMPGVAHRYTRNSPAYLPEVLQVMARLRDRPEDELAGQLLANSRGVLALTQTA
jgi:TatD DNase family protein